MTIPSYLLSYTQKKLTCSAEGCNNKVEARGKCGRHGGRKTCSAEGCSNKVVSQGKCGRHGGKKTCSAEGCNNKVVSGDKCGRHDLPKNDLPKKRRSAVRELS